MVRINIRRFETHWCYRWSSHICRRLLTSHLLWLTSSNHLDLSLSLSLTAVVELQWLRMSTNGGAWRAMCGSPLATTGGAERALTWEVPLTWPVFVSWFRMTPTRSVESISKKWTKCVETILSCVQEECCRAQPDQEESFVEFQVAIRRSVLLAHPMVSLLIFFVTLSLHTVWWFGQKGRERLHKYSRVFFETPFEELLR